MTSAIRGSIFVGAAVLKRLKYDPKEAYRKGWKMVPPRRHI